MLPDSPIFRKVFKQKPETKNREESIAPALVYRYNFYRQLNLPKYSKRKATIGTDSRTGHAHEGLSIKNYDQGIKTADLEKVHCAGGFEFFPAHARTSGSHGMGRVSFE